MVTFITTFAVAILLTNVALQHFGPFQQNVPTIVGGNLELYNGVSISYHELTMAAVSVRADGRPRAVPARARAGASRSARSRRIWTPRARWACR